MADERTGVALPDRPEVRLRKGSSAPSVVARPIFASTPGLAISPSNEAQQLVNALDLQTFSNIGKQVLKETREEKFAEGQLAQAQNQEDWAKAVESGKVDPTANPWFIKGYQAQDGRVSGVNYYAEMRQAYDKNPAKGSDDPEAYSKFVSEFTKNYMETKVGKNRSADWMGGFQTEMQGAQKTLAAEHVEEAKKAVIATQAANTGAEINVILNSTRDPAAAAAAINELGKKMRLAGMPSAAFEQVAAEAILAKAKLGDGNMLKALEGVSTGDGKGTLASNPKVTMARTDVSHFLTEKARGDTRWAWAQADREWTLKQQKRTDEAYLRETERWKHQQAEWGKQEQSRSLMSQIMLNTMSDPANAYANNRERLLQLTEIDARSAESSASFIDGFLQRRERVPEHVERPVIAQLQQDMIYAAGNPERQKQLMIDATRLFADGKLSRDTVGHFIDDANKFASWDPTVQRKLQAPEVERVRQTAGQIFMDGKSQSLYGSAARDALVAKQVVDGAVIEHLGKNPNATPHELGQIATKALEGVIPTLNPNIMGTGRAANLGDKIGDASRNLQNAQPQDGNTPPQRPRLSADQAVNSVEAPDALAFVRSVEEAYATGGLPAMTKAIADFDARLGIPGLGQKLIDKHAAPPAKKK